MVASVNETATATIPFLRRAKPWGRVEEARPRSDEKINMEENTVIDPVDLEALAKAGTPPPQHGPYRIRIDKERYVVQEPYPTGRELLELHGKKPVENYQIFQKLRGGEMERIGLDEKADLTRPGVERFNTLPIDQTEG
jgi:hypothetical protein